jgi:hypothetical protein
VPVVLAPFLISFMPFVAALVLVGLAKASTSQHGSADTGGFWDYFTGKAYLNTLSGFASKFARWVASHFAASQLALLARWFTAMGTLTLGVFTANPAAFEEIVAAIERVDRSIAADVHRALSPVRALAHRAAATATSALHLARTLERTLSRFEATVNSRLRHAEHAIAVTIPREIGRIEHGAGVIEHDVESLRKRTKLLETGAIKTFDWIRTHPLGAAATAFAGAVAVALSRLGLDLFRCNEAKNLYNKRGCGMWSDLDALLGLLVTAVAIEDLETLVKTAQGLEEAATVGIQDLLGVGG